MGKSKRKGACGIGSTYPYYQKYVGEANAVPRGLYTKVLKLLFKKIAQWLVLEGPRGAEWKMPNGLGFLRVAKSKCRTDKKAVPWIARQENEMSFSELTGGVCFYMKWDIKNPSTRFRRKNFWKFEASRGNSENRTGKRGLNKYVVECALDPFRPKYDVFNKYRLKTK